MKGLQKMGGIAALYEAAAYVVGMVGFLSVVDVQSVVDPVEKVALMADNLTFLYTLHLIVYVIWAFFLKYSSISKSFLATNSPLSVRDTILRL